jgi:predicted Zn-dependent protease
MKFIRSLVAVLVSSSLLLSPSTALYAQSGLPNLGDDSAMTLGAERELGNRIAKEIYRDAEFVSDPVLDAYITSIWQPLYAQAKRSGTMPAEMDLQFAWRSFLVRDKSVNAFALPGGYFGVHLGLIALSETPDALASVLAHEITHVTQRHISRGMSKDRAAAPLMVASILVGLLAMRANPQVASAALATGQAASIQGQLNYSRDFEREADRIGFTLMQPAGYSEQGFVDMFDMLGRASRLSDSGNFPYLRSHPLTTERVSDMRVRVSEKKSILSIDTDKLQLHRLMAARAGAMADLSVDAQKYYLQQGDSALPTADNYLATQYSAALAAWQTKEAARARAFYNKLKAATSIRTPPAVLEVIKWLGAELQLPTELNIASNNRVEVIYAAQQLLTKQSAINQDAAALQSATSRLQDWVSARPSDADVWSLLSSLQLVQNRRVRGAIANAEALRAQMDDSGALVQYQAAQNFIRQGLPADSVDAAIVDSKVRELQSLVRDANRKPAR